VGRLFAGDPTALYQDFSRSIKERGALLRILGADLWTSQGFRRGMAQDIIAGGGSLADVLRAGGWRSAAFLLYLEKHEVDEAAALDCIFQHDVSCSEDTLASLPRAVRAVLAPMPASVSFALAKEPSSSQAPALPEPAPRAAARNVASPEKRQASFPDRVPSGPKKKSGQASILSCMKFLPA